MLNKVSFLPPQGEGRPDLSPHTSEGRGLAQPRAPLEKRSTVFSEGTPLQRLLVPRFKLDSVFIFKFGARAGTKMALGFSELLPWLT